MRKGGFLAMGSFWADLEVCVELGLRPESGGARNFACMKVKA